jgi:tetratricopeptide (TPR) repeat protein
LLADGPNLESLLATLPGSWILAIRVEGTALVDIETLCQITSLSALSPPKIAQASRRFVWRGYASGDLILPHQVQLDLEGLVYKGEVQVALVQQGQRRVVDHVQAGEPIDARLQNRYTLPVELRATEPTLLCLLPKDNWSSSYTPARPYSSDAGVLCAVWHTARRRLGVLLLSMVVLLGISAWCWQMPWRAFLSNLTYGLASYRLDAGDEAGALALLQTSVDLNPRMARAYNDLGYMHYRQERYSEAQTAFRQATVSDPTLAVAQNNLGLSYLEDGQDGQLDLARQALVQAVALNPESEEAWANLGLVEQQTGRPQQALHAYRAALRLNAGLIPTRVNLGLLYYELGLLSQAQQHLELALSEQPELARVRVVLGAIALRKNDHARAWRELQTAALELSDDPRLHFYLALWYKEAGMKENAVQELETVLALQPHPDLATLAHSHLAVFGALEPTR